MTPPVPPPVTIPMITFRQLTHAPTIVAILKELWNSPPKHEPSRIIARFAVLSDIRSEAITPAPCGEWLTSDGNGMFWLFGIPITLVPACDVPASGWAILVRPTTDPTYSKELTIGEPIAVRELHENFLEFRPIFTDHQLEPEFSPPPPLTKEKPMSNRLPTLGDKVRDKVTGFVGIVTSYAQHLVGCDRFWIEPPIGADGKRNEGMWLDIDLVEIIEPGVLERVVYHRRAPGGVDLPPPR